MNEMFASLFSSGIWAVIKAVLILLLAFITAAVVKSLVMKLFTKTKLNALLGRSGTGADEKKQRPFLENSSTCWFFCSSSPVYLKASA